MDAHKHYRSFYVWSHLSKYTNGNHQHIIVWLSFKVLVPSDSLSFTFQSIMRLSYPHRVYQPPPPPESGLGGLSCRRTEQTPLCSSCQLSLTPPPHTHTPNPKLCDNLVYLVIIFSIILCLILILSPPLIETTDGSRGTDPASQQRAAASSGGKEPCRNKHLEDKNCRGFIF